MMIIDHEPQYLEVVRAQARARQSATGWRELKKVMEFGYSAVSHANPMIQIVDMVAFTMKKWAEFEAGYRPDWPTAAIDFYCECREIVWRRVEFKTLRFSKLSVPSQLVEYLKEVRSLQTGLTAASGASLK